MQSTSLFGAIVLAFVSIGFYGCSSPSTDTDPKSMSDGHDDHGEHGDHSMNGQSDMEKMKASLAKLSPEDAASAEEQHFCPVTGEMLGTMGAPKKIEVNGQQVWICCDGCKKKLLADPEKYLANLKKEGS